MPNSAILYQHLHKLRQGQPARGHEIYKYIFYRNVVLVQVQLRTKVLRLHEGMGYVYAFFLYRNVLFL